MKCRHCAAPLMRPVIDLGTAPPSNAYLRREQLDQPERWYPLRVLVCDRCWLVQTQDFAQADQLFDADYAYFSSFSTSWLEHARRYVDTMVSRFGLDSRQLVIEIASNDGYLLQYVRERGIPCLGIEPTAGTAAASCRKARATATSLASARSSARWLNGGRLVCRRSSSWLSANASKSCRARARNSGCVGCQVWIHISLASACAASRPAWPAACRDRSSAISCCTVPG